MAGTKKNQQLRRLREQHQLTQNEVAERIGTTFVNVSRWENGATSPGPYFRRKLCELFGVGPKELGFAPVEEAPAKASDRSLPALWNVPYRHNPLFTGRGDVLERIDALRHSHQVIALTQAQAISGLGGIGKTQVAVEYAYRHHQEYEAVLWARADSRELLTTDFVALAHLLGLPERDERDQSLVVAAVGRWLREQPGWLLILDNADDIRVAMDFVDPLATGHVLLTTRAQQVGPVARRIEVKKWGLEESVSFLLRRASVVDAQTPLESVAPAELESAEELARLLDGLPLALDQAGAYIQETACGLRGYLQRYWKWQERLLDTRDTRKRAEHPDSVRVTLGLSFVRVEQASPAAAELLRLCAFLHPDAIPEEIFMEGASELGPVLWPVAADQLELDGAIGELRRFSLLERDAGGSTLTIHRLVQAVLKYSLGEDLQQQWAERTVRAVNRAFPEVEFLTVFYINRQRCERCLPHAQACVALITDHGLAFPEAARLLSKAGHYLRDRGQFVQAEQLARKALDIYEKVLGLEHLDITISLDILGEVCYELGNYTESLEHFSRALSIRRHLLEPEHPDIANNINNLAALYHVHLQHDQAEALYLEALSLRKKILGSSHPDVATSINTLAGLYDDQGRYDEAELLYQQAREMYEETLGPDHPNVAITCNNLSGLYRRQGKYEQAEPLLMRALKIWTQAVGPEHPDVGTALNNLGRLNYLQGKCDQVEPFYKQALEIYEQALGPMHPYVAGTLNNLADLYVDQGKYDEAEKLYQRSLAIREKTWGPGHPDVAQSLYDLGRLYDIQGRFAEAEPLFLRAITLREQLLGLQHPETAKIARSYAALLRNSQRGDEATALEARLLQEQPGKAISY